MRNYSEKEIEKGRSFVFHAPEYETVHDYDNDKALVVGKRFICDDLDAVTNDFDADPAFEVQCYLDNHLTAVQISIRP
ncbi:hypothetical protein L195_g042522 [Trifolium pratense]|uniref:Uncharacterized protein n=1 Tax=Trifolium pratense TaxID=57577 RepID=A0A2K3M6N3_TRIPR|nr:hypothetical protein L195_g042522 [Trifolium pratense]